MQFRTQLRVRAVRLLAFATIRRTIYVMQTCLVSSRNLNVRCVHTSFVLLKLVQGKMFYRRTEGRSLQVISGSTSLSHVFLLILLLSILYLCGEARI